MNNLKRCSKCGEIKNVTDFYKRIDSTDGYRSHCKQCTVTASKKYRDANKERYRNRWKEYSKENREKILEYHINYREEHPDKVKKSRKKHYEANKEKYAEMHKLRYEQNKEEISNYCKQYYIDNKERISNRIDTYRYSRALFESTHPDNLTIDEAPRLHHDGKHLEVKCRYCGKYFIPKNIEIQRRVQALNGTMEGDCYLYCSKHCKTACPTYRQILYPKGFKQATSREVSKLVRQLCFERDNYTCQNCGATQKDAQLHCHHLIPVAEIPQFADDIVNTTTLCKDCHIRAHKEPGMTYAEIKTRSYC